MKKYPTINQYLETMANPHKMFRTLGGFSIHTDAYGDIWFVSGNYAVIFKVYIGAEAYALKCYTRAAENVGEVCNYLGAFDSDHTVKPSYLGDEIFVYDAVGAGSFFGAVLLPWLDAQPLAGVIESLCREGDGEGLGSLAVRFDGMASWLLKQKFAHGDLKNDNILVCPDGGLKLIDYDGMFLPCFEGRQCTLAGSPAYQHPRRDASFFDKHLDDYSIALISVSLHALGDDPSLYARYNEGDNIILNPVQIQKGSSPLLDTLENRWLDNGDIGLYSLCRMLRSPEPSLPWVSVVIDSLCGRRPVFRDADIVDDSDPFNAVFVSGGRYGFIDKHNFEVSVLPVFEDAKPFREGLAPVLINSKWRFIDTGGRMVLDCGEYDDVEPFSEGLSLVRRNGLYGYMDMTGGESIPAVYEFARSFRNGTAEVRLGDSCILIDNRKMF